MLRTHSLGLILLGLGGGLSCAPADGTDPPPAPPAQADPAPSMMKMPSPDPAPPPGPMVVEAPAAGNGRGGADGAWAYTQLPALAGGDYELSVPLRIEEAAERSLPVHQMDRVVDNDNDEGLGGYEAGLVLRRGAGGEMYRFMISTRWREALLWSSRGGVLQVRPFPFRVGETYRLRAVAAGQRLQLFVGDQPLLDAWDRAAPLREGEAALGRKEGAVWFGPATLRRVAPPLAAMPPHQPSFSLRTWKGLRWGFDGDEPVFALGVPPEVAIAFAPRSFSATAFNVKLMPGYGPKLFIQWFMQNYTAAPFALSVLKQLTVKEQGARLVLQLDTADEGNRKNLSGRTTVTLTYDPLSRFYRYDHISELTIASGATLRADTPIDVTDPGIYNGILSATPGLRWRSPYHHSIYQLESGALNKLPHNHVGWYPGWGTERYYASRLDRMKPDGGSWTLVGDPIANPVLTWLERADRKEFKAEACTFSYDLHFNWLPGGVTGTVLRAGTYEVRWRLGASGAAQAGLLLAQAGFAMPGDVNATWLLYTGGVGHVERFDKVVPKASHFGEYPWGSGAMQDTTVGRTDSTSLRLTGPMLADSEIGGNRFTEPLEQGVDYQVSAWVRTQDVRGEGPGILFGDQAYYPGITGTTDWQRIGFVARLAGPADVLPIALHNSGAGTVWFDDFEIRPLLLDAPPAAGIALAPRPVTEAVGGARQDARLIWTAASEGPDGAVLDLSGHGRHGALRGGAKWVSEAEGRVLSFDGQQANVVMRGNPTINHGTQVTLSLWVKPATQRQNQSVLLSTGNRDDYDISRVLLIDEGDPKLRLWIQTPGKALLSPTGVLQRDAWSHLVITHDGLTGRVYVNGALILQGALAAGWLGQGFGGTLHLGAGAKEGEALDAFTGRVSNVRLLPRVLTPAEVPAVTALGAFPPG